MFYRRHVDDTFAPFSSPDHADDFKEYLSSKHININFSIEEEKDGYLPFLDVDIFCENKKFATNIEKKLSVGIIPTSKVSYQKHTASVKSLLF